MGILQQYTGQLSGHRTFCSPLAGPKEDVPNAALAGGECVHLLDASVAFTLIEDRGRGGVDECNGDFSPTERSTACPVE